MMQTSDDRLKKNADGVRGERALADNNRTNKDGTSTTIEERRKMLRDSWNLEVLPTPPEVPGFHLCWLSTTNQQDPIYKRMQLGYEPVKVTDVPGLGGLKITSGEFEGCVAVNEMILFKIPEELYQEIMLLNHFERPNDEEEVLKANAAPNDEDSDGRQLGEREGFGTLARKVRTPTFA